jgi:hypothetical protein
VTPLYTFLPKGNFSSKTPKTSIIRSANHDQRHGYEEERKEGTGKKPEGKKSREETEEGRKKALHAIAASGCFEVLNSGDTILNSE